MIPVLNLKVTSKFGEIAHLVSVSRSRVELRLYPDGLVDTLLSLVFPNMVIRDWHVARLVEWCDQASLQVLGECESPEIRASVIGYLPTSMLAQKVADPDPKVRKAVARRVSSSAELFDLLEDPEPEVRMAALLNTACPKLALPWLLEDSDPEIRLQAAMRCQGFQLKTLSHDPDPRVRRVVADKLRLKDLPLMFRDQDPKVREIVAVRARNIDSPLLVSGLLGEFPGASTQFTPIPTPPPPEKFQLTGIKKGTKVSDYCHQNGEVSDIIIVRYRKGTVRFRTEKGSKIETCPVWLFARGLSRELLVGLAQDPASSVRAAVVCGLEVKEAEGLLKDSSALVRKEIAYYFHELSWKLRRDPDPDVRAIVAATFGGDPDWVLGELVNMFGDPDGTVRYAAVRRFTDYGGTLTQEWLIRDTHPLVRRLAAKHLPIEWIPSMLEDSDHKVRKIALKRLPQTYSG